jgi:hypothetical protein
MGFRVISPIKHLIDELQQKFKKNEDVEINEQIAMLKSTLIEVTSRERRYYFNNYYDLVEQFQTLVKDSQLGISKEFYLRHYSSFVEELLTFFVALESRDSFPPSFLSRKEYQESSSVSQVIGFLMSVQEDDINEQIISSLRKVVLDPNQPFEYSASSSISAQATTSDQPGGIDMNAINVDRQGSGVDIQFDPIEIQEIIDAGIDGFAPVIINLTPLPSVLPLLGLEPRKEEEMELSQAS